MDGVELVLAALTAGATAVVTDATSAVIRDTAASFRSLVRSRLTGRGQEALQVLEVDGTISGVGQVRLIEDLVRAGVDRDEQILRLARDLVARAEAAGGRTEIGHADLRGAQGVQLGSSNTQHNTFR
ncbi:hypothetical protein F8271_08460 [Micromonospora sp. ALFpr18c]|uniref:hypothetical protein n=1 Tax=unclassified Micromonospora TaxID=2617518 RepID=UPI00124BB8AE|nr:hypothetical protein [Micromonospora sp. ALFpr18c]KAB1944943.1 hypothetical protein F8271_08460 [Micromonospora sp. ALFpr18c]